MDIPVVLHCVFIALLTSAAMFTDIRSRRIPNWLTVSGLVLGITFHTVTNGLDGLQFSLGGFAVGFGVLFVLWLIGGGGGGDVKLMGAIGAWMGAVSTFVIFMISTILALVGIVAVMVWKYCQPKAKYSEKLYKQTIPYAIPAGLAAWVVMLAKITTAAN